MKNPIFTYSNKTVQYFICVPSKILLLSLGRKGGIYYDCQDTTVPLMFRAANASILYFYLNYNYLTSWWDSRVIHLGVLQWSLHKHTMPTTSFDNKVLWIFSFIFELDDSSQLIETLQIPRAELWKYYKLFCLLRGIFLV